MIFNFTYTENGFDKRVCVDTEKLSVLTGHGALMYKTMADAARVMLGEWSHAQIDDLTRWYYGKEKDVPWGCLFVVYCGVCAKVEKQLLKTDSTLALYNHMLNAGKVTSVPEVGGLVFVRFPGVDMPSNVGVVTEVYPEGFEMIRSDGAHTVKEYQYKDGDAYIYAFAKIDYEERNAYYGLQLESNSKTRL